MSDPVDPNLRLHCLGGESPASEIVDGWRRYLALPDAVRADVWSILTPLLLQPLGRDHGALLTTFAARHEIASVHELVPALQTCCALLRSAAVLGLDRRVFDQDLARLTGRRAGFEALLAGYEAAAAAVREAVVQSALGEHGKVLTGLGWRIDRLQQSSQSGAVAADVIFLTLHYSEGAEPGRITLQLTPALMQQLKGFCDRFQPE